MKYFILNILLFTAFIKTENKYMIISMPCSGTHQLIKCVNLLYHNEYPSSAEWQYRLKIHPHYKYSEERALEFKQKKVKLLLNVRDPRDRLISYSKVYQACKEKNLTLKDISLKLILKADDFYWNTRSSSTKKTLADEYSYYIPWLNEQNLLLVTFENLIGPKGGGSLTLQKKEIEKIANFLDITLSEQKLNFVLNNLFGATQSFRNPQIGAWKKHWTEKHTENFYAIGMKKIGKIFGYSI